MVSSNTLPQSTKPTLDKFEIDYKYFEGVFGSRKTSVTGEKWSHPGLTGPESLSRRFCYFFDSGLTPNRGQISASKSVPNGPQMDPKRAPILDWGSFGSHLHLGLLFGSYLAPFWGSHLGFLYGSHFGFLFGCHCGRGEPTTSTGLPIKLQLTEDELLMTDVAFD